MPDYMAKKTSLFPRTLTLFLGDMTDDDQAWQAFFNVYGPILYRMARHARLNDHDAEEIVANVMRNYLQARRNGVVIDHEIGRLRDYLRTITNREIAALRRRQAKTAAAEITADPAAPVEEYWADEIERQEWLRACLERLGRSATVRPRDLEAFVRYKLEDQPAEQVAKQYGVTVNRLYQIAHEMMKRLRKMWADVSREMTPPASEE